MVDRVHIPRRAADAEFLVPGTWYVDWDGNLWYKCPDCKKGGVMNHSVSAIGEVNPSIMCWSLCQHHMWGILDGWIYGEKRLGGRVKFNEETCPGHVASEGDSKICGRCGVHINSLRPDND